MLNLKIYVNNLILTWSYFKISKALTKPKPIQPLQTIIVPRKLDTITLFTLLNQMQLLLIALEL